MRSSRGGQPSRECVFREAERPRFDPLSTLSLFGGRENQFWTTRLYYLLISMMRPITGGMYAGGEFLSQLWFYGLWALVVAVDRP